MHKNGKPADQRRDARVLILVTRESRDRLEMASTKAGLSMSEMARTILGEGLDQLDQRPNKKLSPEMRKRMERELLLVDAELAEAERRGLLPVVDR